MKLLSQTLEFDLSLLRKYDRPVPRYTSYPPATEFKDTFAAIEFNRAIAIGNYKQTPLSLYCHIPFCETACYFCGCNTIITQKKQLADPYLDHLCQDIEQTSQLIGNSREVNQLHWGGGTPNYLSEQQVERLWTTLNRTYRFAEQAEISIEVNPRFLTRNYVFFLKDLGFKRISFGIQDFDERVQVAINRVQPEAMLFEAMEWIREAGFESVNVDLIYGLPYQTLATFRSTIQKTIRLNPDRIAVFNFAYVPWMKPIQKRIPQAALPSPAEKLSILQMSIEELTHLGYVFIGMDHFAKPEDELAIAQREGQLHRNFQGYTTLPESDLLGFGMTSISMLDTVYVQNQKRLKDYYRTIKNHQLPIEKGIVLNQDDRIRRSIITELMCQYQLSKTDIEEKYHLSFDQDFEEYFAREQYDLHRLEADNLLNLSADEIRVTPLGRLLIRNIVAVFDTYLRKQQIERFSQAV